MKPESRQKFDVKTLILLVFRAKLLADTKSSIAGAVIASYEYFVADSNIPSACNVYQEMSTQKKLLASESMLTSAGFSFIPKPVHKENSRRTV
jgi:hypothetical protein